MFLLLVISNVSPFSSAESFVPFGGGGGVGMWGGNLPFYVRGLGLGLGFFTLRMPLKKKPERNSSKFQSVNDPPSILYYS